MLHEQVETKEEEKNIPKPLPQSTSTTISL